MTTISANRTHAHVRSQAGATPRPSGFPVLPAVDLNLGTVAFHTPNGYRQFWSAEPEALVNALGQSVCSPQWIPEIATLVVTVAQTGVRTGRRLGFRLLSN